MGNELIAATVAWLRRYVYCTDAQALTLAAWALHTWVYEQLSRTTPYVEITGVSGSGKTTIMEALSLVCRGSKILNTLRTLAMCRLISEQEGKVTMLVDEAERLNSAAFGDQRSMLASGYRRGGQHMVSVGNKTATFEVWCPKVFTTTRTMTTVLHNRSIPIWAERGKPEASLSLEWERAEATAAELVEQLKNVIRDLNRQGKRLVIVEADWLQSEREREIWTPLISLATSFGADEKTMSALRAASVDLSALRGIERHCDAKVEDEAAKERSYATMLIRDVCKVLHDGEVAVFSRVLVDRLRQIDVAPWRSYQRTGLTELTLAQLLGAWGLESKTVRVGSGRKAPTSRGYKVSELRAALKLAGTE